MAGIVFAAATDYKDQLRYIAGKDSNALYDERIGLGAEEQVRKIRKRSYFSGLED